MRRKTITGLMLKGEDLGRQIMGWTRTALAAWTKGAAIGISMTLLVSGTASAAIVTADQTGPVSNGAVLSPDSTTGNFQDNIIGNNLGACSSTVDCARTPFEGTALENTAQYSSVQGGGTATYNLTATTLLILWGSPDTYNHIDFYRNNILVDTVAGDDGSIVPPATLGTGFANVQIAVAGGFDMFVLRSETSDAFEYANVSAVPLPAALPLFGAGLMGLLGLLGWRRRRAAATV